MLRHGAPSRETTAQGRRHHVHRRRVNEGFRPIQHHACRIHMTMAVAGSPLLPHRLYQKKPDAARKHHLGTTSKHQPAPSPTTKVAPDQYRRRGKERGITILSQQYPSPAHRSPPAPPSPGHHGRERQKPTARSQPPPFPRRRPQPPPRAPHRPPPQPATRCSPSRRRRPCSLKPPPRADLRPPHSPTRAPPIRPGRRRI